MPMQLDIVDRTSDENGEPARYQNTYRLESYNPFKIEPVDKIVEMVMTNHLEDAVYDATEAPKICSEISSEIRKRILKLEFDRYKIVVIVTLIEKSSQSLESSMGFIWDVQRDNYSTYTLETQTFYAYCCVFGVYYE
ncbi:tctex1 domain-containing protein 1-A isoform X2 [Cephus cinctus]|uniref:Tctex1 domain-containing protein 1-A isoform X2 n=1 Tax=Cephus cinctus TaxID=211228 RepID=A0AAJ7CDT4_CEPCN|nr:tctex1 domain-containing protein 1-A isoform X2 [Cephus cinctus]